MGLARDLVELAATIQRRPEIDIFAPLDTGGLNSTTEFNTLLARVRTRDEAGVLRLCLQALRIQHDEFCPRLIEAELVATLPSDTPSAARPTHQAIRVMIEQAGAEIILLGYELTDRELILSLAAAAARGVEIVLICDRTRGVATRVREHWPSSVPRPRVLHDRQRADSGPYASMHAKCLLVDGLDLLVTSANFTFHGLRENIEIGLRIGGSPAAEARKIFSYLVENRLVEHAE